MVRGVPQRQQLYERKTKLGCECLTTFLRGSLFVVGVNRGARISMVKFLILVVGLFVAVPLTAAQAQNRGLISPPPNQANQGLVNPRVQSFNPPFNPLDPRQACTVGSQSVRVCQSDFQSCNSACTASNLSDPIAGAQGCSQRCCNNLRACFSIRGCGNLTSNDCFTPTNPNVRALTQ